MNRLMHPFSSMDRLFNGFLNEWPNTDRAAAFPPLNVWEDEQNFFVEAELPGLRMDDLELTMLGDELTIKGERKDSEHKGAAYHRRERGAGRFTRAIRLPAAVETENIKASLQDGVLSVSLPKAKEAQPHKIQVKCLDK